MRTLLVSLFLLVLSGPAMAATLAPTDNPHCRARFEGVIQPGDLERFRDTAAQLLRPDPGDPEASTHFLRICLDSPGGSLLEAVRIAELVAETGYGTVIDAGDECVSACAVLFMFGSHRHTGQTVRFNRRLHVDGRLGFHRPDFALPQDGAYRAADVEKAFDIAILATLEFVRIANRRVPEEIDSYVPADLIEQMFAHEGADFYVIETVNQAGRWNIDVFGHDQPTAVSARDAITACHNLANWTYRLSPEPVRIPMAWMDSMIRDARRVVHIVDEPGQSWDDDPPLAYFIDTGPDWYRERLTGQDDKTCMVQLRVHEGEMHLSACGRSETDRSAPAVHSACGMADKDAMRASTPLAAYPSDLRLDELSAWSARMSAEAAAIDAMDTGGPQPWCRRLPGDHSRVVNVNEYVNIREAPGFEAPVVAQAGRHLLLRFGGNAQLWGDAATRGRCEKACIDLFQAQIRDDSMREPVAACMDENAIWFDVEMPNGKRGWVSAKYTD